MMMNNSPWFFISIGVMVALMTIAKAYSHRIKQSESNQLGLKKELSETVTNLEKRLTGIESRIGNLESIVIEQDREQRFRDLK